MGLIAMRFALRASSLAPSGFIVEGVDIDRSGTLITARPASRTSQCPECGAVFSRIHNRYRRQLADLPIANRPIRLVVQARRFRCDAVLCGRRIFAERFDKTVAAPWSRRTARFDQIVQCLGLVLGGRPAARFARRLALPISNDTLLCVVRRY